MVAGLGDVGGGIGSAIGGIAVLAGAGGKGGDKYYKQALETWKKLQDPSFDYRELTPPELKIFAEYFPQTYEAVVPPEAKQIAEDPALRLTQLRGLKQYERQAAEGLPIGERVAEEDALRNLGAENQRNIETARRGVAALGRTGTTDDLVAQSIAASRAGEDARLMGGDLAARIEANRARGLEGAMGAASGIRGEDFRANEANANIMNRLAEFIANQKTEANRYAADARGAAANANVGNRQRIGEENVLNRYGTNLENLNRKNQLRSALSNFQLQRTKGLSEALGAYGLKKDQDKAAREQTIMSIGRGVGQTAGGAAGFL